MRKFIPSPLSSLLVRQSPFSEYRYPKGSPSPLERKVYSPSFSAVKLYTLSVSTCLSVLTVRASIPPPLLKYSLKGIQVRGTSAMFSSPMVRIITTVCLEVPSSESYLYSHFRYPDSLSPRRPVSP